MCGWATLAPFCQLCLRHTALPSTLSVWLSFSLTFKECAQARKVSYRLLPLPSSDMKPGRMSFADTDAYWSRDPQREENTPVPVDVWWHASHWVVRLYFQLWPPSTLPLPFQGCRELWMPLDCCLLHPACREVTHSKLHNCTLWSCLLHVLVLKFLLIWRML